MVFIIRIYTAKGRENWFMSKRLHGFLLKISTNCGKLSTSKRNLQENMRSIFVDNSFFRSIIIIGYFRTKEDFHG